MVCIFLWQGAALGANGNVLEYQSSDVPNPIPDQSTLISIINIANGGIITDLDVQLTISHYWVEDLDVFLIGPDGTQVELFTDVGGRGRHFVETRLDDEASDSITDGVAPFTGSYRPEGNLSDFDGKSLTGQWQLQITDDAYLISGILEDWCLVAERGNDPFFEEVFQSTEFDPSQWTTIEGAIIDDKGINEPSSTYSLHLDGDPKGGDLVESKSIDLSQCPDSGAVLRYLYERTGSGNSPEIHEDLIVDYWDGSTWVELQRHAGDGPDMTDYEQVTIRLPVPALHEYFSFRIYNSASSGAFDDWFVDDVYIYIPSVEFRLLGGTGSAGTNSFSLVELQTDPVQEIPIGKARYNPGLDTDPSGTLYGASNELRIIDPTDGSSTRVGSIDSLLESRMLMRSISFAPDGRLYGVATESGDLYEIDPETAWATWICEIPEYIWGIDFAPDGTLYGAAWKLFIIDIDNATCQVVEVGDLVPHTILNDIDVAPDGFIYAVNHSSKTMYKIDPDSDPDLPLIINEYGPYETEIWGIASQVLTGTGSPQAKAQQTRAPFKLLSVDEYSPASSGESSTNVEEMLQMEQALKDEYQRVLEMPEQ